MDDLEQPSEELEIPKETPEELSKDHSKFALFLRKLLRWLTGALTFFALGIVLTWIVQVSPRVKELRELKSQFELVNLRVSDLEYEVSALQDTKEANISLGTSLEKARLHLIILGLLANVSSAQLALINNSPEASLAALSETNAMLTFLSDRLDSGHSETIKSMQERLSLVLDEMNEDPFAAQSDMEVLHNSILALEQSLFGN